MVLMVLAISLRPWCGMRWIGCHCLWRGVFLTFTEKKRRGQEESKESKRRRRRRRSRRRRSKKGEEEKRREEIKEKTKVRGNISSDETFDYFFPRLMRLW